MLTLQPWQVVFTALLPFFSTVFAGIVRQDRAPGWLNDVISFVTPLGAGVINAAANGAPTNANGLLFLTISALLANLSHVPLLYNAQQWLQSRVLSLGVSPAQVQQIERDFAPLLKQSLDNLATVVGAHLGILQDLHKLMATPPTTIGQAARVVAPVQQPAPVQITPNPAFNATSANPSFLQTSVAGTIAGTVPQQPFPPLNRWGTAEVPTPQG